MRLSTRSALLALLLTTVSLLSACDKNHDPRPGKHDCKKHTPPPPAGGNS